MIESAQGTETIEAETIMSTFMVMGGVGPGTEGYPVLQQAVTRFSWNGEVANGMMARSLPGNLMCDLYYTLLEGANPGIDPVYVCELNMEHWSIAMDRMLAFRQDPANDARFFDIGFTEFQADPISQIRRLYGWLGDELTQATVDRMLA